jgi:hypothetical protein
MRQMALPQRRSRFSGAARPLLVYILFICAVGYAIAQLSATLVRHAGMPLSHLLVLGDDGAAPEAQTASAVLESDEWLQNLKAKWQDKNNARMSPAKVGNAAAAAEETARATPENFSAGSGGRRKSAATSYRTVCVRLCDGYFFPLSFATSQDQFAADQATCARSCASPAKLYVYENPGQEPEQMVDLAGRPYAKLSTAFLFRSKLDLSCKCNPNPWEQEAVDRHRKYAETAAKKKQSRQAALDAGWTKGERRADADKARAAANASAVTAAEMQRDNNVPAQPSQSTAGVEIVVLNIDRSAPAVPPRAGKVAAEAKALAPPQRTATARQVLADRPTRARAAELAVIGAAPPKAVPVGGQMMRLNARPAASEIRAVTYASNDRADWKNKVFASR